MCCSMDNVAIEVLSADTIGSGFADCSLKRVQQVKLTKTTFQRHRNLFTQLIEAQASGLVFSDFSHYFTFQLFFIALIPSFLHISCFFYSPPRWPSLWLLGHCIIQIYVQNYLSLEFFRSMYT